MITIRLDGTLLPEGATITAELSSNSIDRDIEAVRKAVLYVYEEAAKAVGSTPNERLLSERLDAIDKFLNSTKSPLERLEMANKARGL